VVSGEPLAAGDGRGYWLHREADRLVSGPEHRAVVAARARACRLAQPVVEVLAGLGGRAAGVVLYPALVERLGGELLDGADRARCETDPGCEALVVWCRAVDRVLAAVNAVGGVLGDRVVTVRVEHAGDPDQEAFVLEAGGTVAEEAAWLLAAYGERPWDAARSEEWWALTEVAA
jgi:hypothetical protein